MATVEDELFRAMTVGVYLLKSKLGQSPQSIVWKAEHTLTGEEVVVKQVFLSKLNKHLKDCLDCEINFLSCVNLPNTIRLLQVFQVGSCAFLVLEFCDGGDLASYIKFHGRVDEKIAKRFMLQLSRDWLEVLHRHHLLHRDLKPQNVLFSGQEGNMLLKIADFGLSRSLLPGCYVETACGSPFYMAPDVLQFQRYDHKVDMWSLGAILFELLNGYPPFHGRSNLELLRDIKSCQHLPFSKLILPVLHPDCVDICTKLLSANPADRLSFDEFCHHRFLGI